MEKALFAFSTTPFIVTILSGVEPSEIVIRAPLLEKLENYLKKSFLLH